MSMIEQFRYRAKEFIDEFRKRFTALRGESRLVRSEGQLVGGLIGGGKVIENVTKTIDEFVRIVQERKPNIIPIALERIRTMEPGKRVKELLPKPTLSTPTAPAPSAPTTEKKLLRG